MANFCRANFLLFLPLSFCEKNIYVERVFIVWQQKGSSRPFALDFLVRVDTVEGVIIWWRLNPTKTNIKLEKGCHRSEPPLFLPTIKPWNRLGKVFGKLSLINLIEYMDPDLGFVNKFLISAALFTVETQHWYQSHL